MVPSPSRVFWVISLCVGMFGASYYISELWDKWESGPVLVSIDTTAHPVSTIPFPAVTICSVNKVEKDKLKKSIEALHDSMDKYDHLDIDVFLTYLDYMIRYEDIDLEDQGGILTVLKRVPKGPQGQIDKLYQLYVYRVLHKGSY